MHASNKDDAASLFAKPQRFYHQHTEEVDNADADEDSFTRDSLFRRKPTTPMIKRAKQHHHFPQQHQQQQHVAMANFNPFALAEHQQPPPTLDNFGGGYHEPPSLISINTSFASSPGRGGLDYDDDEDDNGMEELVSHHQHPLRQVYSTAHRDDDDDDSNNSDEEDGGFRLTRRFSSTMFFDAPPPSSSATPPQQHTPRNSNSNINGGGGDVDFSDTPATPQRPVFSIAGAAADTPGFRVRHQTHHQASSSSRFSSEFETLGLLGSGSFGKVYKVKNRLDGCLYAVKMVQQSVQRGKTGRERVLKEVYALSALVNNSDNLHVVRYFSSWIDVDDCLYIQTELCDTSLEKMLQQPMHHDFRVQPTAVEIFKQLLQGLKGLHLSNVVHLDIKPANILFRQGTYKLGDLGHAALCNSEVLPAPPPFPNSQSDAILAVARDFREGDVRYMARELLNEDHTHLPKADIFSLGAAVYEMFLTKVGRKLPSEGPEWLALRGDPTPVFALPDDIASQMSGDFKELVHLMMHSEPGKRPTAEALLVTGGPGNLLGDANNNSAYRTNDAGDAILVAASNRLLTRKNSKSGMFKRSNTM